MSTATKLEYLNDTKGLLKDSINSLGGNITSQTTFRNYATELDSIYASLPKVSGSGSNISLSPTKVGRITSQINGDTLQDGTPTPSSPIEIQSVTGLQKVSIIGKNKLNIQTLVKGRLDNGVVGYESGTDELIKNENSFSFTTNTNYRGVVSDFIEVDGGKTYYMSLGNSRTGIGMGCACYDENKVYISTPPTLSVNDKAVRYEIPSNAKYCRIGFQLHTAGTITITNPQFEENEITDYEPYQSQEYKINLGNIHLYEGDQIIGTPNNWSIKHVMGEVVLDGTNQAVESYNAHSGTTYITATYNNANIKRLASEEITVISNKLVGTTLTNTWRGNILNSCSQASNGNYIQICLPYSIADNLVNLNTWLSNNNIEVKYVLETPTTEPITNTELISQLNDFYNAKSYNGQTNISVEGDLPMILDVSAIIGDE